MPRSTEQVLRWGRSAYETDADLAQERADAHALGWSWTLATDAEPPSALETAGVLVVNSRVVVDAAVLRALEGGLVITTTSGFDHIDLDAATSLGVQVARCPLARRDAVVETTLAGLLGLVRELPRLTAASGVGRWARGDLPTLAPALLSEQTVAVVGCGVIGSAVCERLAALGAEVLAVDPAGPPPHATPSTLTEALDRADALTLHCSLSEQSRGLIDAAALDRLRPGAVVVNTARGDLLDVDATVERVRDGRLRGALLDVFPTEPYPRLRAGAEVPGVWFLPHAAGYSRGLGQRVAREVSCVLRAWSAENHIPNKVMPRR